MSAGAKAAKARIEFLRREIARHNELYYGKDAPEISDAAFDALFAELQALEKKHPQFGSAKSPAQTVGAAKKSGFAPIRHLSPMRSLNNAFSEEEVLQFARRAAPPGGAAAPGG